MNMIRKRISILLFAFTILFSLFLSGCSKKEPAKVETPYVNSNQEALENYEAAKDNLDNIYYNTLNKLNSDERLLGSDLPLSQRVYIWFYNTYSAIANAAPMIIALSIFLGILTIAISRKNKRIQRFALIFLIILIPLATVAVVYGFGASPLFKYK